MELWQKVFREGFAPSLNSQGLKALRDALETDSCELVQGITTSPPPLNCTADWDTEATCAIGYCGWKGMGLKLVGEVEEFFARCCHEAGERMGDNRICCHFLDWFDNTPRNEMRERLIEEIEFVLENRGEQ